jgi:hypothetical protein
MSLNKMPRAIDTEAIDTDTIHTDAVARRRKIAGSPSSAADVSLIRTHDMPFSLESEPRRQQFVAGLAIWE